MQKPKKGSLFCIQLKRHKIMYTFVQFIVIFDINLSHKAIMNTWSYYEQMHTHVIVNHTKTKAETPSWSKQEMTLA